jgi:hypothetical protein
MSTTYYKIFRPDMPTVFIANENGRIVHKGLSWASYMDGFDFDLIVKDLRASGFHVEQILLPERKIAVKKQDNKPTQNDYQELALLTLTISLASLFIALWWYLGFGAAMLLPAAAGIFLFVATVVKMKSIKREGQ